MNKCLIFPAGLFFRCYILLLLQEIHFYCSPINVTARKDSDFYNAFTTQRMTTIFTLSGPMNFVFSIFSVIRVDLLFFFFVCLFFLPLNSISCLLCCVTFFSGSFQQALSRLQESSNLVSLFIDQEIEEPKESLSLVK